jgi:hypothetical protein
MQNLVDFCVGSAHYMSMKTFQIFAWTVQAVTVGLCVLLFMLSHNTWGGLSVHSTLQFVLVITFTITCGVMVWAIPRKQTIVSGVLCPLASFLLACDTITKCTYVLLAGKIAGMLVILALLRVVGKISARLKKIGKPSATSSSGKNPKVVSFGLGLASQRLTGNSSALSFKEMRRIIARLKEHILLWWVITFISSACGVLAMSALRQDGVLAASVVEIVALSIIVTHGLTTYILFKRTANASFKLILPGLLGNVLDDEQSRRVRSVKSKKYNLGTSMLWTLVCANMVCVLIVLGSSLWPANVSAKCQVYPIL